MMPTHKALTAALLTLLVVAPSSIVAGCGSSVGTEPVAPRVARLAIVPPTPHFAGMAVGVSFRFAVEGFDATGALLTELPPVTWTSSDTTVATVDSSGLVVAKHDGRTVITAAVVSGSRTVSDTIGIAVVQQL